MEPIGPLGSDSPPRLGPRPFSSSIRPIRMPINNNIRKKSFPNRHSFFYLFLILSRDSDRDSSTFNRVTRSSVDFVSRESPSVYDTPGGGPVAALRDAEFRRVDRGRVRS